MKFVPLFLAIAIVVAMPVFGWHAIPAYFNHSVGSAVAIGIVCGALLSGGIIIAALAP